MHFLRTKKPVPFTIKVQFFTVTGFVSPTISADSCAVKICSVGNFRNQLPFYIKTYIFSDKLIVSSVSDGGNKLKKSEFNLKYSEIIF